MTIITDIFFNTSARWWRVVVLGSWIGRLGARVRIGNRFTSRRNYRLLVDSRRPGDVFRLLVKFRLRTPESNSQYASAAAYVREP